MITQTWTVKLGDQVSFPWRSKRASGEVVQVHPGGKVHIRAYSYTGVYLGILVKPSNQLTLVEVDESGEPTPVRLTRKRAELAVTLIDGATADSPDKGLCSPDWLAQMRDLKDSILKQLEM